MSDKKNATQITDSFVWRLKKSRPFVIDDTYKLELIHIDFKYKCATIKITNLKTGESIEQKQEI